MKSLRLDPACPLVQQVTVPLFLRHLPLLGSRGVDFLGHQLCPGLRLRAERVPPPVLCRRVGGCLLQLPALCEPGSQRRCSFPQSPRDRQLLLLHGSVSEGEKETYPRAHRTVSLGTGAALPVAQGHHDSFTRLSWKQHVIFRGVLTCQDDNSTSEN